MEKKFLLIGLVVLIVLSFLFLTPTNQTIEQTIIYSDFNVTKQVIVQKELIEKYSINQPNPSIGLLIIPKNFSYTSFEGDFNINELANNIFLLSPLKLNPGEKQIKLSFSDFDKSKTTILFFLPANEYNSFTILEKNNLLESLVNISNLDSNYFSYKESLKIMQEFANGIYQKKILTKEKIDKKNKFFFSSKEKIIYFDELNPKNIYSDLLDNIFSSRIINSNSNKNNIILENDSSNFLVYSNTLKKIIDHRKPELKQINLVDSNFSLEIKFNSQEKESINKIVIPYSKENQVVIWNGEVEIESKQEKELLFEEEGFENKISFEYLFNGVNEKNGKLKYLISFVVDTQSISSPFNVIKGNFYENQVLAKKYPVEITLIENPCEKRVNQYTLFENDYSADVIKQSELINSAKCFLGIAGILDSSNSKPDQSWIGVEDTISSELLLNLDYDLDYDYLKKEQKEKRERYLFEFKSAQAVLEEKLSDSINEITDLVEKTRQIIELVEDHNIASDLNKMCLYAMMGVLEKKLLLDPTNFNYFKERAELEIQFYSNEYQNSVDENDFIKLREMIYADNYQKFGAWDSDSLYLETSLAKYNIEQELYSAMKDLAKKMSPTFKSKLWKCLYDEDLIESAFDPFNKNFYSSEKQQSLRETILYIGLAPTPLSEEMALERQKTGQPIYFNEFITKEKALEKLKNHVDNYCGFLSLSTNDFQLGYDYYSKERIRVANIFRNYIGIKLFKSLAYDLNEVESKIIQSGVDAPLIKRFDINYYPPELNINSKSNGKTIQEIYLADKNTLAKWVYLNENNLIDSEKIYDYIHEAIESSLNSKIKSIEHLKFRSFIYNMSQAQSLGGQVASFEKIIQNEYNLIINLLKKEEKSNSINYILSNIISDFSGEKTNARNKEIEFRMDAIKGIKQIRALLLKGYSLPQIDQNKEEWGQKPDFDSAQNNKIASDLYVLAKKIGSKEGSNSLSSVGGLKPEPLLKEYAVMSYSIDGSIKGYDENRDFVKLATLLPQVRVELKKFYISESNKLNKKSLLESAKSLFETQQIIMSDEYNAKLLLEVANYYYLEGDYYSAVKIYGDIKANFKGTSSEKKATEKLDRLSSWRMVFSKPYWEAFGEGAAEFVTLKSIAYYYAVSSIAKYVIAPELVKTTSAWNVQKAYAINSGFGTAKLIQTSKAANISKAMLKSKNLFLLSLEKIGRLKNTTIWKIINYDLNPYSNADLYSAWLKKIANEAAKKESLFLINQANTLKAITSTPLDDMSITQLNQVESTLNKLKQHNIINENQYALFNTRINDAKPFAVIETTPINASFETAQVIPISAAKSMSTSSEFGVYSATDNLNIFRLESAYLANVVTRKKSAELMFAKEIVSNLQTALINAQKSKFFVSELELKFLSERLIKAKEEVVLLENSIGNLDPKNLGLLDEDFDALAKFSLEKVEFSLPLETYNTFDHAMEIVVSIGKNGEVSVNQGVEQTTNQYLSPKEAYASISNNPYLKHFADTGQVRFLGVDDFSKECGYPLVSQTGVTAHAIPGVCLGQNQMVLVNVQHFKFTEVSGNERIVNLTAVMEHELNHRGFYWVSENQRQYIISRFISNPDWEQLKQEFLLYFPSYKNKTQTSLITEMISKTIQNEYLPSWYNYSSGSSEFLRKRISPIIDTTTRQLLATGRQNWFTNYQRYVAQVSKTKTESFWIQLKKIFNFAPAELEVVTKTIPEYDLAKKSEVILRDCDKGCVVNTLYSESIFQAPQGVIISGVQDTINIDFSRIESLRIENTIPNENKIDASLIKVSSDVTPTLNWSTIEYSIANAQKRKIWFMNDTGNSSELGSTDKASRNIQINISGHTNAKGIKVGIDNYLKSTISHEVTHNILFDLPISERASLFDSIENTISGEEGLYDLYYKFRNWEVGNPDYFLRANSFEDVLQKYKKALMTNGIATDYTPAQEEQILEEYINLIRQNNGRSYGIKLADPMKQVLIDGSKERVGELRISKITVKTESGQQEYYLNTDTLFDELLSVLAESKYYSGRVIDSVTALQLKQSLPTPAQSLITQGDYVAEQALQKAVESEKHPDLLNINSVVSEKILSFICESPCEWTPVQGVEVTNYSGASIAIIEGVGVDSLKIIGNFEKKFVEGLKIIEYTPQEIIQKGIISLAAKGGVPSIEVSAVEKTESLLKEGKTIGIIFTDSTKGIGKQSIIFYTPTNNVLNNLLNPIPIQETQNIITEPVINEDLASAIQKLGIKKGDVVIFESKKYDLWDNSRSYNYPNSEFKVMCPAVFDGLENGGVAVIRNGIRVVEPLYKISGVTLVQGDVSVGLSEEGIQKLTELKNRIKLDPTTGFPIDFDPARDFPNLTASIATRSSKQEFLTAVDFFEEDFVRIFNESKYANGVYYTFTKSFDTDKEALQVVREVGFEKFGLDARLLSEKEVNAKLLWGVALNKGHAEQYSREFLNYRSTKENLAQINAKIADALASGHIGLEVYEAPPYDSLSYVRSAKGEFFVHFTSKENVDSIADEGFKYGITQLNGMQLTAGGGCSSANGITGQEPGYNMACVPGEFMKYPLSGNAASGMMVIKTDAVVAYHSGDTEQQAIFYGPDVNPYDIVPLTLFKDDTGYTWSIELATGTGLDISSNVDKQKSIDAAVAWVKSHWDDFKRIRELNSGSFNDYEDKLPASASQKIDAFAEKWREEGLRVGE